MTSGDVQLRYRTQGWENVEPFLKEKKCFLRQIFCQYFESEYFSNSKMFLKWSKFKDKIMTMHISISIFRKMRLIIAKFSKFSYGSTFTI